MKKFDQAATVLGRPLGPGHNTSQATFKHSGLRGDRIQISGSVFAVKGEGIRINGVTYGPFAPNAFGEPFPTLERLRHDFAMMLSIGINSVRTYHLPPEQVLQQADDAGMKIFVDAPWSKHLCFLDSESAKTHARETVRKMALCGGRYSCLLAYSIGNEIPPDVVRWHGARKVQRFLAELTDVVKQADPAALVTYANYPPTEYLELPFLDFATFNVYLHDREVFRKYLLRLQNLIGNKPLLIGELGLDTLRHGELQQADFLAGHLREVALMGLAGAFVFSWTDDWHTGGFPIEDWAFGITHRDRVPKASAFALQELFRNSLIDLCPEPPRVSVIVCTYNGARTLEQCLCSLENLKYSDYEIIVVNDGSTDDTRSILARFPSIKVIHQDNLGLSAARNAGIYRATGSLIAYTDDDCFVDPNWLTHLVYQFQSTDAAAVGGPNLSPDDGWMAACVAASPGQPTHVLESDHVAEHIPGCNMAFRRDALLAINGFDVQYRKAGDDVDVCWKLQQAGYWITFAPGAFVWHHRRHCPRTYLRQQAGYGEAEALLRFAHPERFNGRGDGKWRGIMYGVSLRGLQLKRANIYRGIFGTGMFQTLYTPGPSHWAMLPSSLEWHLGMVLVGLLGLNWSILMVVAATMLMLSILVAAIQASQASIAPKYEGLTSRLLIMCLCYLQPLVRSWSRYKTRYFASQPLRTEIGTCNFSDRLSFTGRTTVNYWSEDGTGRLELLGKVIEYLNEQRWGKTIDTGWQDWDLQIDCRPGTVVQVCTVQEEHGGGKRRVLVRFRLKTTTYTYVLIAGACTFAILSVVLQSWPVAVIAAALGCFGGRAWTQGLWSAGRAVEAFDLVAKKLKLVRCESPVRFLKRPAHVEARFRFFRRETSGQPADQWNADQKDIGVRPPLDCVALPNRTT